MNHQRDDQTSTEERLREAMLIVGKALKDEAVRLSAEGRHDVLGVYYPSAIGTVAASAGLTYQATGTVSEAAAEVILEEFLDTVEEAFTQGFAGELGVKLS